MRSIRTRLHLILPALGILGLLALPNITRTASAYVSPAPVAEVARAAAPPLQPMLAVGGCLGSPKYLGTIDYTNVSKTQASATTAFAQNGDGLAGRIIMVQPTTAVYVLPDTSSSATAVSTTSVLLQANERVCFYMHHTHTHLAAIRSATSGNLLVWEMLQ